MQRCICIGLLIALLLKYGDANCAWTRYFDRDNPSATGDHEQLSLLNQQYPGEICANPIAIDARVRGVHTPYQQTGETVTANLVDGFICLNSQQRDRRCLDYEVRFCCPPLQTCDWKRWLDRDNPGGNGDYETLSHLRTQYPSQTCDNPTDIQARTVGTHIPYQSTGESLYVSPQTGLTCVNKNQRDGRCLDYEVRFCCPRVLPPCQWTQFYDRDNPSSTGDHETLADLRRENRGEICARPYGIDARVVDTHLDYSLTGEVLTVSPHQGLRCLKANQADGRCMDYEVRFCCAVPRPRCVWTKYFDRDNPGGVGDFEQLSLLRNENPRKICQNPALFDARVVGTGLNYALTGEVVTANTDIGLVCRNGDQTKGICSDYEIRFCCYRRCTWTQYYNRDRPGSTGDHETLAILRRENPGLCPTPLEFQARTSGTKVPYFLTGERVTASTTYGLRCLDNDQSDGRCMDYEVRFCCPPRRTIGLAVATAVEGSK